MWDKGDITEHGQGLIDYIMGIQFPVYASVAQLARATDS